MGSLPPSSPTSSILGSADPQSHRDTFFSTDQPLPSSEPLGAPSSPRRANLTRGGREDNATGEEVPLDALRQAALADLEGISKVTDAVGEKVQEQFERFLETYRDEDNKLHYIEQIKALREYGLNTVYVDWSHLGSIGSLEGEEEGGVLAAAIRSQYYRFLPFIQKALRVLIRRYEPSLIFGGPAAEAEDFLNAPSVSGASSTGVANGEIEKVFQIAFYGLPVVNKIRDLHTDKIGTLLTVSGTVTRTSEVRPELHKATFTCDACSAEVSGVEQVFRYTEPYLCPNPTCQNSTSWTLVPAKSQFVDWQRVRVQENPGEIPTGSMPRTLDVILRGNVVDTAKAGDKCTFTGTAIVIPDVSQMGLPGVKPQAFKDKRDQGRGEGINGAVRGLKALGARELTYRIAFLSCMVQDNSRKGAVDYDGNEEEDEMIEDATGNPNATKKAKKVNDQDRFLENLTAEEVAELKEMMETENLYGKLVQSVAPTVWGHEIIKKGLLLQLLGGVHKTTVEGIQLRGDINICIVGDPSTSKSQFLKYICGFLPRAVYTSGKASSAAGLTAAVVKDEETQEHTIEAGALMLADNGICAIDEFDKMDTRDQVAIHEAMEQQTISIAKAGIHATLNARTSILAAANPINGRYNRKASLRQNISMTAPIMSRFDLFFVVLDECNEQSDTRLADHIVALHMDRDEAITPPFSTSQLRRYIMFARTFKPKLNREAKRFLVEKYKELRMSDTAGIGLTSYRITVRQLESLIRLSEAIARAHCLEEVTPEFVREAYNLLRQSIIHVDRDDVEIDSDGEEYDLTAAPPIDRSHQDSLSMLANTAQDDEMQSSQKTKITYDKYMDMVRLFVQHIQEAAENSADEGDNGVSGDELIRFYLESQEDVIDSEATLNEERKLARKVLKRMVRDHILLELRGTAARLQDAERDERLLDESNSTYVVHPNALVA